MVLMRTVLIAFVMGVVATSSALAKPRTFVVGVEELDYFPSYAVRDGEYVGAARDILDAFAQAHGYTLTFRPLPIKRLYAELLSGGIDFKFPDNPQWAADVKQGQPVRYSQPVIAYVDGVMVLPDRFGGGADAVRTLGTVSGFTPFAWLDRIRSGQSMLKENPRIDLLLRQVMMGRMDGAYASVAVAYNTLERELKAPGALVFDPALPHSRDFYRLSSLNHPEMVAQFDEWMAANRELIEGIKLRHGAEKGVN